MAPRVAKIQWIVHSLCVMEPDVLARENLGAHSRRAQRWCALFPPYVHRFGSADWKFGTEGQCVITLGTDARASAPAIRQWTLEKWGRELLAEHNYAVVGTSSMSTKRERAALIRQLFRCARLERGAVAFDSGL